MILDEKKNNYLYIHHNGTLVTYMYFTQITLKDSPEYAMKKQAKKDGKIKKDKKYNHTMIDGRIAIAMKPNIAGQLTL